MQVKRDGRDRSSLVVICVLALGLVGCNGEGRPSDYLSCLEKVIFETKSDIATRVGLDYCETRFPDGEKAFRNAGKEVPGSDKGWETIIPEKK